MRALVVGAGSDARSARPTAWNLARARGDHYEK
jgi:hypothetical protein